MEKGDFIEFDYTGKTNNGFVFDTTIEAVAKKTHLKNKQTFKPVVMCLGQGQFLPGLDEALVGKDVGTYTIRLAPEKAFGKKDVSKIQTVPISKFTKEGLKPYPGMQINVDGDIASVKRVSGGRVLVDRNHPLAGLEVVYDVDIKRKVTDAKEKVDAYVTHTIGNVKHEVVDNKVTMFVQKLPEEPVREVIKKQLQSVIPEITDVEYKVEEPKAEAKE